MKCPACHFEIKKNEETREIEDGRGEKQVWHESCHRAYTLGFIEGTETERRRQILGRGLLNAKVH